jgi:[CysO sulfur-carrier protein]-S-L-cysteine hydrolase
VSARASGGVDGAASADVSVHPSPVIASELAALELDRTTFDTLVAQAWSDFPYEVCGLLGLHPDGRVEVLPIRNAERSMRYYVMDSRELLRAMRRIEDEGLGLVIYHSHTHTRAYPSETDVRHAAYPDALYAIVTLQDHDAPDIRAFTIREGAIEERPVTVRD